MLLAVIRNYTLFSELAAYIKDSQIKQLFFLHEFLIIDWMQQPEYL